MDSLEKYQHTIREYLFQVHNCPYEFTDHMLSKYSTAVEAMFNGGVAAVDLVRWFYLEWHCR